MEVFEVSVLFTKKALFQSDNPNHKKIENRYFECCQVNSPALGFIKSIRD